MFLVERLPSILREGLLEGVLRLSDSSVTARRFARCSSEIPPAVLVRHLTEHVFRIRMFRPLDALATEALNLTLPDMATVWSRYARSEALHDRYFLRDLAAMGFPREAIDSQVPFNSTVKLGQFMRDAVGWYGALPVVLYSFWTEENSQVGSAAIVARTTELFGAEGTRGAAAHRALDQGQDHCSVVATVLASIIRDANELMRAMQLLQVISDLIREYFDELDQWSRSGASPVLVDSRFQQKAVAELA